MLKVRFIAVLIVRDGTVVQSEQFNHPHVIHRDPVFAIECFNKWAVDEIVVLNVSRDEQSAEEFPGVIERLSDQCFVPMTVGGWVRDVDYARRLLHSGADKIVVNTAANRDPELIGEMARAFGSQCVIVSIDAKTNGDGTKHVFVDRGCEDTGLSPVEWARRAQDLGAGELFVNSIDHDGKRKGYDLELMRDMVQAVTIPVIAFGGVQTWQHMADGVEKAGADAVAAANILHYTEHSCRKAKKYLIENGINVRR